MSFKFTPFYIPANASQLIRILYKHNLCLIETLASSFYTIYSLYCIRNQPSKIVIIII